MKKLYTVSYQDLDKHNRYNKIWIKYYDTIDEARLDIDKATKKGIKILSFLKENDYNEID